MTAVTGPGDLPHPAPPPPGSAWGAPVFVWGVWALMVLAALAYVVRYGSNVPSWDEWDMVPTLTGEQPVTLSWLWSQHSEHRIPLPRLVMLALNRPFGIDFRLCMYLNVVLAAALALGMVVTARWLRGRVSYTDAFFPLLLLNGSHGLNFLWGWQVAFFLPTALAGIVLVLIVRSSPQPAAAAAAAVAVCLALLVGCGAHGVALVPPLALWLGFAGVLRWRAEGPRTRRDRWLLFGLSAAALLSTALYFVGYESVAYHPTYRGLRPTLRTGLEFLTTGLGTTMGLGTAPQSWWPWSGWAVLGLLPLSAAVVVAAAWRRPAERCRALGLLLFLGAMVALGAALGTGRTRADPRYIILAVPVWCCVFFIWELYGPRGTGRWVRVGLLAAACAALWPNTRFGLDYARDLRSRLGSLERDMAEGVPVYLLVARYGPYLHPDQKVPTDYMPLLRRSAVGSFAFLRDNPALREVPVALAPVAVHKARWEAGTAYVTGYRPHLVFALPQDRYVCGVRLRYVHTNEAGTLPYVLLCWKGTSQEDFPEGQCWKHSPTGDRLTWERGTWQRRGEPEPTMLVWVCDRIGQLRLQPDFHPCTFKISELVLLVPEADE